MVNICNVVAYEKRKRFAFSSATGLSFYLIQFAELALLLASASITLFSTV